MNSKLLLLDGATGTELNRRGLDTGLPLWSANAMTTNAGLCVLRQVHLDYLNASADVITANTFRTNRRALAARSLSALELTLRGSDLAPCRSTLRSHRTLRRRRILSVSNVLCGFRGLK